MLQLGKCCYFISIRIFFTVRNYGKFDIHLLNYKLVVRRPNNVSMINVMSFVIVVNDNLEAGCLRNGAN